MKPIQKAVGQTPIVILTPMRPYAQSTCCENSNHITTMEKDLEDVRKNMRSFILADNVRRAFRAMVVGPWPLMTKMGADCWADDPVHPRPTVYQELAKLVMSTLERLEDKVEMASSKFNRNTGGGRDWGDRRWGRGGDGARWPGRGARGRMAY